MSQHKYSVAHIVEWNRCGQACFALIHDNEIIGRFTTAEGARAAYRMAVKALKVQS